jgi:hypothetical protein
MESNINSIFWPGGIRLLHLGSRIVYIGILTNVLIFQEQYISIIANLIVEEGPSNFKLQ